MSSALVSASLGSACILPCKIVAVRSGGHHGELRSGEKMDEGRSFRRPPRAQTTRGKLAKIGGTTKCPVSVHPKSEQAGWAIDSRHHRHGRESGFKRPEPTTQKKGAAVAGAADASGGDNSAGINIKSTLHFYIYYILLILILIPLA